MEEHNAESQTIEVAISLAIIPISWVLVCFIEYIAENSTLDQEFVLTAVSTAIEVAPEILEQHRDLSSLKNYVNVIVLQCLKALGEKQG